MQLDPVSLLAWSVRDVRNRHLRFIASVDELHRLASPGHAAFVEIARARAEEQLRQFDSRLVDVLDSIRFAEDNPDNPSYWSAGSRNRLAERGAEGFKDFALLQRELFPHLPLRETPPDDLRFFLSRCLLISPTRRSLQERFAVVHGQFASWMSPVFVAGSKRVAIIPVPFAEILTPLRWPLLVHELAHWVKPGGEPLRTLQEPTLQEVFAPHDVPASAREVFDEVFADLVASRSCGFSYAIALATEAHLASYDRHATSGFAPALQRRLELMGEQGAKLAEGLPEQWNRAQVAAGEPRRLDDIVAAAREVLAEYNPPTVRPAVVAKATELFSRGEPASAVHLEPRPQPEDFDSLANTVANLEGNREKLQQDEEFARLKKRIFRAAAEEACTDAEILEAAWADELGESGEATLDRVQKEAEDTLGQNDAIREQMGALAKRDIAVSRSLQAAAVHRWLTEHDAAIRDNVSGGQP